LLIQVATHGSDDVFGNTSRFVAKLHLMALTMTSHALSDLNRVQLGFKRASDRD